MKESTKDKLNKLLKYYFYIIILPSAIVLGVFNTYYFFTEPSMFTYQYLPDCVGMSCPEPVIADGINVLGIPISEPFVIPIINEDEFNDKKRFMGKINFWSLTAVLLLVAGFAYDRWGDIKNGFKD